MITATDLEVRAGARILLSPDGPDLRIQPGDRIGLVGRNGAGKTTTLRILAGESEPYAGSVTRTGEIGYLPQDPKEGDLDVLARDRVLSARGLDVLLTDLEKQQALMAEVADDDARDRAIRRYGQLEERFVALGGYGAESEAGRICASLGLPERVMTQQLRTLSGGQRRRVELARILFAASDAGAGFVRPRYCSTNRPTTWTRIRLAGCGISCGPTMAGWWSSATTSNCSPTSSTGCGFWTPCAARSTSTTWAGRSISTPGPPTNSAAAGNVPTPNARPPRCVHKPPSWGLRPPKPLRRRICCGVPTG